MSQVDRTMGLVGNVAMKAPCRAATTGNIVLSAEQTIDGIACVTGDRVLVRAQTTPSQNGIYVVDSGSWERAMDFDGAYDVVSGTLATVLPGGASLGATCWRVSTTGTITIGTSNITWQQAVFSDSSTMTFIQDGAGAVQRTAQDKMRDIRSVFDFMTVDEIAAYKANNYAGTVTNVTAAVQAAITAGSVYFPPGTARLTDKLTGVSNTLLTGPGVIDTNTMYAAGKTAAIYLDGVHNFVVDGLGFNSAQLSTNESAVYLRDTVANTPCYDITVRNCQFTNIKIIKSDQANHSAGSGYEYSYYATATNRHRRITITGNRSTKPAAGLDNQGYAVWLFFCDKVVVANNMTEDTFGLCFLWNGNPSDANWLVSYQYGQGHVVSNNVATGVNNGVVVIACKDTVVSGNVITATATSGEVLDCEGGRNVIFNGNTVAGGQSLINTFFTNNDVVFENNTLVADTYTGGNGGNGIYNCATGASDPDLANSGRIVIRGNRIASVVGEAFIGVGWCKDMVIEDNRLSNVTIFSNVGTNSLIVRNNVLDFTVSPTYKPAIQVGKGNTAKWTAGTRSPRPKIQVAGNIVEPNLAGGVVAVGVFVDSCTQETTIDIFGNRFDNTTSNSFVLETGGGVRRIITFKNNALKAATPFVANAPIANDLLLWKDNTDVLSAIDALGAITGSPATNLTVDAIPITNDGSLIWNNANGAATQVGWIYDSGSTTWRKFGVTY